MKMPKQFALSTLLLVMLLVSLVFGYAQWRKQRLHANVVELNNHVGTDNALRVSESAFWPTAYPERVVVSFTKNAQGQFEHNGKKYDYEQLQSYLREMEAKFLKVGVDASYQQFRQTKNRTESKEIHVDEPGVTSRNRDLDSSHFYDSSLFESN